MLQFVLHEGKIQFIKYQNTMIRFIEHESLINCAIYISIFYIVSVPVEPVKVDPGGESEGDSLFDGPSKLFKLVADWNPDS